MRSTPCSTVFCNRAFACLLAAIALLAPAAPDGAAVGVLRFKSHVVGYDPSAALQWRILEAARARTLFSTPPRSPGAIWYPYEAGCDISQRSLARYEAICSQLGCGYLLMGRIYANKNEIRADTRIYSSVEKRFICVLSNEISPGSLKQYAQQTALRVSLFLLGRLPVVTELKISKGSSSSEVALGWKCTGSGNTFIISRSPHADGPFGRIGETESTRFIDTTAEQGMKYWYTISVTRYGLEGVAAAGYGYRKPQAPQGLTVSEMLDGRTRPWPRPATREEEEREKLHLRLFEKYYESPFMVAFIIMVGKMYVNSGELIAFRDFTSYTWEPGDRVIYLIKPGMPRIKFHSRRFFRFVRDMHDLNIPFEELMPRVIGNAILFCVRTEDRETKLPDGRIRYIPVLEGIGLSTEYHRDYERWRSNTIVFSTSTDALYKRILDAQRRGY